jgi:hypothetical protein
MTTIANYYASGLLWLVTDTVRFGVFCWLMGLITGLLIMWKPDVLLEIRRLL